MYTVILLLPDYAATDFGHDIAVQHVQAPDVKQAITNAQQLEGDLQDITPEDFYPLAAFEGTHENLI